MLIALDSPTFCYGFDLPELKHIEQFAYALLELEAHTVTVSFAESWIRVSFKLKSHFRTVSFKEILSSGPAEAFACLVMAELELSFKERVEDAKRWNAMTPPRYDAVYYEGIKQLDML